MNKTNLEDNENKTNKKKKNKGFYVALGVCVVAIGAATFTTYKNIVHFDVPDDDVDYSQSSSSYNQSKLSPDLTGDFYNKNDNKKIEEHDTKAQSLKNKVSDELNNETEIDEDLEVKAKTAGLLVFPNGKNILKEYSNGNPVYSKTFCDWRVHNGVDFSSEKGSKVSSITDGIVKNIFEDPLLGMTVEIEHDGGFTAFYSGLGNTTLVNTDDKVETGQDIGSINDIPGEIADGDHLHLAIKKDGKFINPLDILGQP